MPTVRMGKQASWKAAPWKQGGGQAAGSPDDAWSYWAGSWRTRQSPKQQPKDKDSATHSSSKVTFPLYCQVGQPSQDAPAPPGQAEGLLAGEAGDPFVKTLQRMLNTSRKLDAKLRKLKLDRQEKPMACLSGAAEGYVHRAAARIPEGYVQECRRNERAGIMITAQAERNADPEFGCGWGFRTAADCQNCCAVLGGCGGVASVDVVNDLQCPRSRAR